MRKRRCGKGGRGVKRSNKEKVRGRRGTGGGEGEKKRGRIVERARIN